MFVEMLNILSTLSGGGAIHTVSALHAGTVSGQEGAIPMSSTEVLPIPPSDPTPIFDQNFLNNPLIVQFHPPSMQEIEPDMHGPLANVVEPIEELVEHAVSLQV